MELNKKAFDGNNAIIVYSRRENPETIEYQDAVFSALEEIFPNALVMEIDEYLRHYTEDNRFAFFFSINDILKQIMDKTPPELHYKFIIVDYSWLGGKTRYTSFRFSVGGAIPKMSYMGNTDTQLLGKYQPLEPLEAPLLVQQSEERPNVLIILPDDKAGRFFDITPTCWLDTVLEEVNQALHDIKPLTRLRVRRRNATPLQEDLDKAFVVIGMHSATLVEAFAQGIPVISHGPSPLSFHTLSDHRDSKKHPLNLTGAYMRETHGDPWTDEREKKMGNWGEFLTELLQTQLRIEDFSAETISSVINAQVSALNRE